MWILDQWLAAHDGSAFVANKNKKQKTLTLNKRTAELYIFTEATFQTQSLQQIHFPHATHEKCDLMNAQ